MFISASLKRCRDIILCLSNNVWNSGQLTMSVIFLIF